MFNQTNAYSNFKFLKFFKEQKEELAIKTLKNYLQYCMKSSYFLLLLVQLIQKILFLLYLVPNDDNLNRRLSNLIENNGKTKTKKESTKSLHLEHYEKLCRGTMVKKTHILLFGHYGKNLIPANYSHCKTLMIFLQYA